MPKLQSHKGTEGDGRRKETNAHENRHLQNENEGRKFPDEFGFKTML